MIGTSNTDFINKLVLEISLFPQWRGKISVWKESSESLQYWRCRQAPNPRGTDFFCCYCSQKHWKMPVQKIDSSIREELRDLMMATRICGGARKMVLLSHPQVPEVEDSGFAAGTKEKLQGFSKDPKDVGACVMLKFRGYCAINSPHVPLRFKSSVFIYGLSSCIPLNGKSWEWVIVGSENSVLATSRQPPVWVEGSNLLSIRCSVSQKGLTEQ